MNNVKEEVSVDQTPLAEDVSSKIKYEFFDSFLVKPLDPVKVMKEFSTPVSKEDVKKDKNGVEAVDYDEVKTETKEVEANYRRGIVLKVPYNIQNDERVHNWIKIGDIIVYPDKTGRDFDLLKDSKLVRFYEIVAIETK
jgi:hypothetical protein